MRYGILFLALAFFLPYFYLAAESPADEGSKIVTEKGVILKGMPKANLENAGFTGELMVSDNISDNQEYITFQDISTLQTGDNITFYIEDEKIVDWFRGTNLGTLEENVTQ